jgi:hypothetical protein
MAVGGPRRAASGVPRRHDRLLDDGCGRRGRPLARPSDACVGAPPATSPRFECPKHQAGFLAASRRAAASADQQVCGSQCPKFYVSAAVVPFDDTGELFAGFTTR